MPVFDLFFKRKEEAAKSGKPIIYRQDILPSTFRIQVVHIIRDSIVKLTSLDDRGEWWTFIHDSLAREMGVMSIVNGRPISGNQQRLQDCTDFLTQHNDVDKVLSLIEIIFRFIDYVVRQVLIELPHAYHHLNPQTPDDAIVELNHRFQEHAIGYQYQGGQIIEVNSQYLHAETVEPAITLLFGEGFEGALEEFMAAHRHYRERRNEEAITEACKAFESTMKAICERKGWAYSKGDTASRLLAILYDKQLIPPEMQSHFNGLRTTLESGVPTLRNNYGGHGQGTESRHIPDHYVSYALHLAASNIVFLMNSYREINKGR